MISKLAEYRKAVVALIGLLAEAVSWGVLPAKVQGLAATIVAAAIALGVYQVPNRAHPAPDSPGAQTSAAAG